MLCSAQRDKTMIVRRALWWWPWISSAACIFPLAVEWALSATSLMLGATGQTIRGFRAGRPCANSAGDRGSDFDPPPRDDMKFKQHHPARGHWSRTARSAGRDSRH